VADACGLKAHGERQPNLFEILLPQEEADTIMLYEVYASPMLGLFPLAGWLRSSPDAS
jgi:hypothetical protein